MTAHTNEEAPSLTLEALEETMAELKAKGPFPTELWFVDCHDKYDTFIKILPRERVTHTDIGAGTLFSSHSLGIRVIEWYMRGFDPDSETIAKQDEGPEECRHLQEGYGYERVWPWFVAFPGVWARMSDGSVLRTERQSD